MTSSPYVFGTVCVAPFPFSDMAQAKHRPLVILAPSHVLGAHPPQHLCAMITSTRSGWDSDVMIKDYEQAGLLVPCSIRLKLFTLDERLLVRSIGHLSAADSKALRKTLATVFAS
ncbi:MAG: type II toxin-antitoxin system PemK/MazF family toxin [Rickettsiales bacterium]|nr:type II toxin-antitoxin system PemK/MazF family toxin [Rickettsiales bacterium]